MSATKRHASEPWQLDEHDPRVVNDSKRQIAALAISPENALRIISSVNAVRRVSSKALDAGIISEGLLCLYLLCRYHSDDDYKGEVDREARLEKLLARGNAAWGLIGKRSFQGETWAEV